jgi:PAS domain S-box-containing protein
VNVQLLATIDIGTTIAAITAGLVGLSAAWAAAWSKIVKPWLQARKELSDEAREERRAEISELKDEIRQIKEEHKKEIDEVRKECDEKIIASETWYQVQLAKMDTALVKCHEEREHAIKNRESAMLALTRYEERLRYLERAMTEGKVTARPDENGVLRIVTANIGMTKIFGYTRAEMAGMEVEKLIAPKDRDGHLEKSRKHTLETDIPFSRVINGGLAMHKNGTLFPVTVELQNALVNGHPGWSAIITQD